MAEDKKSKGQKLQEQLAFEIESAWTKISDEEKKEVFNFCEGYKSFLNTAKTERLAIEWAEAKAKENGFVSLDDAIRNNRRLNPGERVYTVNKGKNIILAIIGQQHVTEGINMIGAHVDAPRLDLKPSPLIEEGGMAFLKTHYYGGIKKYQWTTIPLAIHGVIFKGDGQKVVVNIGEDKDDPQFCITDLLPHLAQEQMQKKMSEAIAGEGLNILFGSIPYNDDKLKEKVKVQILEILNQKYGIKEEDFVRAELEVVPAFEARDIGLDRSMIGAYGQDDRVCAYASFEAILKVSNPKKMTICLLVDKEEIGSAGNTGMQSTFMENTVAELCMLTSDQYSDLLLRRSLNNSKFLSADVTAAVDPGYEGVQDKKNATFFGKGVTVEKYTGSRGKSDASDANAEMVSYITNLLNNNKVMWQTGEIGKVDLGGGGTIAQYVAKYGTEVIDMGPGLLSMHAPFEISNKIDVYMAHKAYLAFYNN